MQRNQANARIELSDDVHTPGGTIQSPGGTVRSLARFIPRQGSYGLVDYGHERRDANRGGGPPRRGWGEPYNSPPTSPQEQPFWPQRGTPPPDFL